MKNKKFKKFTSAKGRQYTVTFYTIDGKNPGPVLTLISGQHGMEHTGPAVLIRLIDEIDPGSFNGTLQVCPCANPAALELDYEFYPERENLSLLQNYHYSVSRHDYCIYGMERAKGPNYYNMNRLWNRKGDYGLAGKITDWLWREICQNASVIIDFHSLQAQKPLIFSWDIKANTLASFFGIEAIYMHYAYDDFNQGNLGYQANTDGKTGFCVEFSCQHGYKEEEFPLGRQGILNIMKTLGMMKGDIALNRPVYLIKKAEKINARHAGYIHYYFHEYDSVAEGQVIYEIRSIETLEILEQIRAGYNGVMGKRTWRAVSAKDEMVCDFLETETLRAPGIYCAGQLI